MCNATCGKGLQMEMGRKFVYTDLQRGTVAWDTTTLLKTFLNVPKYLVVFMRKRTNALVCQKY